MGIAECFLLRLSGVFGFIGSELVDSNFRILDVRKLSCAVVLLLYG